MNLKNEQDRRKVERLLKADTVEMAPLPGKQVYGPCWVPKSRINTGGEVINDYATIYIFGMTLGRHVVAAALVYGDFPPPGMEALHGCDRKACCNPGHIRVDTHIENSKEAVGRGLLPKPNVALMVRGENHPLAKLSNEEAACVKWLIANRDQWFVPAISKHHSLDEALGIHFGVSAASVKQLRITEGWRHVTPSRPDLLPTPETIPPDAKAPRPQKAGPIGSDGAREILLAFHASSDQSHFVTKEAKRRGVSPAAIYAVLKRKIFKYILPEHPPVDFSNLGQKKITDIDVQRIRATWNAYKGTYFKKGLISAIARKFGASKSYTALVVKGVARIDVPDDPSPVIPIEELEFMELTRRGVNHPLYKLSDADIMEIHRRATAGESKTSIAVAFDLSWQWVHKILRGETRPELYQRFHEERGMVAHGEGRVST